MNHYIYYLNVLIHLLNSEKHGLFTFFWYRLCRDTQRHATMDSLSAQCKVRLCFQCQEDTAFYCGSCMVDLCVQCKEKHVTDLSTKEHNIKTYSEKIKYNFTKKMCTKHSDTIPERYSAPNDLNSTDFAKEGKLCALKREEHLELIDLIRSDVLYYRGFMSLCIKSDVEALHDEISQCRLEMLRKANTMRKRIDDTLDFISSKYVRLLNSSIHKQKVKMTRHIATIQMYDETYELSGNIPLRVFLFRMKVLLPKIQKNLILAQHSKLCSKDSLHREDVVDLLSEIQMNKTEKRSVSLDRMLKIYTSVLHGQLSISKANLNCCIHISCLPHNKVWICDKSKLVLMDTSGVVYHRLNGIWNHVHITGLHSVNRNQELIYISSDSNLIKLSEDMKTMSIFFKREKKSKWRPQCLVCSHSSGDVLVGMWKVGTDRGKIMRLNSIGKIKDTIKKDKNNDNLYKNPMFITENYNGDIVVSDLNRCLVVTDRGGEHRFSYTGHPTGSGLTPCGICTDIFSNILVCDKRTNTVQMIDKDGAFMYSLLTESDGIFEPWGLCYDIISHLLWVGSDSNNVVKIFRYINRQDILTG